VVCFKQKDELREEGHRDEIDQDLLFELQRDFGEGGELYSAF